MIDQGGPAGLIRSGGPSEYQGLQAVQSHASRKQREGLQSGGKNIYGAGRVK